MNRTRMQLGLFSLVAGLTFVCGYGCEKSKPSGNQPAAKNSAKTGAGSSGSAKASASAPARKKHPAEGTWKGTYTATSASVTPPDKHAAKRWADPGKGGMGPGTIEVSVAGKRLALKGNAKGALGDQLIVGEVDSDGSGMRARVHPKKPNDPNAMTGILVGKIKAGTFTGTMRVADRQGNRVRKASVTLKKAKLCGKPIGSTEPS